ncbi:MAG: sporulation protein YlmC with PRC-barrel domain [Halopseudomonas sp.]|jgi:sporulation protein YlmC with PRC-barrel domain|uniref:PRC-barrel domain-containing protein n=1 Tax=Halopseudomonas sp. TaxID=2901191 RepID=UPI0039E618FB
MTTHTIRKLGIPLLAGAMGLSFSVIADDHNMDAQGLYSADDLIGAEVFDANGEEVGNVEDILLGNDMSLHALVIQTNEFLGIGENDVVAKRGEFTVSVAKGEMMFDDINYDVHMTSAGKELKGVQQFNEQWWNESQDNLNKAWENTMETTSSAWENTKQATSSAWNSTMQGVENMVD